MSWPPPAQRGGESGSRRLNRTAENVSLNGPLRTVLAAHGRRTSRVPWTGEQLPQVLDGPIRTIARQPLLLPIASPFPSDSST